MKIGGALTAWLVRDCMPAMLDPRRTCWAEGTLSERRSRIGPEATDRLRETIRSSWSRSMAGRERWRSRAAARPDGPLCPRLRRIHPRSRDRNLALPSATRCSSPTPTRCAKPGEPPLKTLAEFCARHLKGMVSGIHLLPFYPWSSDDGFSVKDFFAVEPSYGTWEDIARLGADFDLMFDAVFNHVSAQGEWFQRFLADDPRYRDFFIAVAGSPDLSQVVRPRALPLLTEFSTAAGPKKVWTTFSADQVDLNFKNPGGAAGGAGGAAVLRGPRARGSSGWMPSRFSGRKSARPACTCRRRIASSNCCAPCWTKSRPHVLLITETNVPHARQRLLLRRRHERSATGL